MWIRVFTIPRITYRVDSKLNTRGLLTSILTRNALKRTLFRVGGDSRGGMAFRRGVHYRSRYSPKMLPLFVGNIAYLRFQRHQLCKT